MREEFGEMGKRKLRGRFRWSQRSSLTRILSFFCVCLFVTLCNNKECGDAFCNECHTKGHAKGSKMRHKIALVDSLGRSVISTSDKRGKKKKKRESAVLRRTSIFDLTQKRKDMDFWFLETTTNTVEDVCER